MKKLKRRAQSICAMVAAVATVAYYTDAAAYVEVDAAMKAKMVSEELSVVEDMVSDEAIDKTENNTEAPVVKEEKEAKQEKGKTDYIVRTKTKKKLTKVNKKYTESTEINDNSQNLMEDNKMTSLKLSGAQAEKLEKDGKVKYIEEDVMVSASGKKESVKSGKVVKKGSKKENRLKKNDSKDEWNVRMIKADSVRAKNKEEKNKQKEKSSKNGKEDTANQKKIKVAVLDSGVDAGNDIDLVYSVSLVPGEEEMTPIFMDGTGHGSSVASLIAARDDGKGITGINPDAEIYSIRVLDDFNEAPLSRVIEGIYMAIDLDVNIINMSFGLDTYSEALEEAIQDAEDAGILVIAAAGNTGDEGVQYPAAYEEVMAVGSVDKDGEVAKDSAKGEEVEIVAPGEVVRTTGFIGTEEVVSGTSLAAPQIAAVASLIWQKDPNVSADFVRGLLNESANQYGEEEAYGNGLVDAEYALEHYDEYKEKYEENAQQITEVQKDAETEAALIPENESEITTFEETGCVEGSWRVVETEVEDEEKRRDHVSMVDESYFNVRMGVRLPDYSNGEYYDENIKGKSVTINGKSYTYNFGFKYDKDGSDTRKIAGESVNPWWHGYYTDGVYDNNYIMAVIYATRMANALESGISLDKVDVKFGKSTYKYADEMRKDIKNFSDDGWKYILAKMKKFNEGNSKAQSQGVTGGFKRAVVWGMAIHSATDIYAHSTQIGTGKGAIKHTGDYATNADNPDYYEWRYIEATEVAKQMMKRYAKNKEVLAKDLLPGATATYGTTFGYTLTKFSEFVRLVDQNLTYYPTYPSK